MNPRQRRGVLFLLQALATVVFGVEFRNIGVRLPAVPVDEEAQAILRAFEQRLTGTGATEIAEWNYTGLSTSFATKDLGIDAATIVSAALTAHA